MKKTILAVLSAAVLCACGERQRLASDIDMSEVIDIAISNENRIYSNETVCDLEIIPLESPEDVIVGSTRGLIISDGHIIVYDDFDGESVHVFRRDGTHRATINRRGRGPQEYEGVSHVALTPGEDVVAIYDNSRSKVLYFTLDGHFIESKDVGFRFSGMEYIDKDNLVCVTYKSGNSDRALDQFGNPEDVVVFTDEEFRVKGSALPRMYNSEEFHYITPNFKKFDDRIYVCQQFTSTIYQAGKEGLKATYRIDLEKIGGVAEYDTDLTSEQAEGLKGVKPVFSGSSFVDTEDYVVIGISAPPQGYIKSYLYSKHTGKVYHLDKKIIRNEIFRRMAYLPSYSSKGKFVISLQAHYITMSMDEESRAQVPELAGLTEDSNPVIVLYRFKEGL